MTRSRGIAGEGADSLFVVEQTLALLLHEHPPEQVAEQAHIRAKSRVRGHGTSLEKRAAGPGAGGGGEPGTFHAHEVAGAKRRNPPRGAGFGWSRGGSNP